MNYKNVMFEGELFNCRYAFDIDNQLDTVDVYYINENDEEQFVGNIGNLGIPDEDDEEQIGAFEMVVTIWLYEQDVNYTRG
jgi:hypothetical protein